MSNSIKELYEINKNDIHNNNSSYKLLYDELLDKLNRFEIKDDNLNTFYIYIVYSPNDFKNISNRGNIIYAYEKEVEFNSEQEIKISLFKTQIDFIEKNIIKENKLDVKVIIAFNCKKEVIENKYFINTDNSKKEEVKLNVFPIEPKYNMSQIILNDSTFEEIQKVSTLIKNIQKIYYDWGFSEIDPVPRCIVNFYGPPGTGKTMSAHIIASELNTKILPLNYSDIESKFVGDAPKNLVQAFEIAKRENCLLFFDEADSFLGKRITNVSSSSDQAVNSLRSQMLILLESFNGVVIFATNLHENYDSAFESRILRHIKFELPDKDIRLKIIKKMIPSKAPIDREVFDDEYLMSLSEIIDGFSPREIKNTILEVCISSIQKNAKMDRKLFDEVFSKSKEKFEQLKAKSKAKKDNLSSQIKDNLENKNYNVQTEDGKYVDAKDIDDSSDKCNENNDNLNDEKNV